MEPTLSSEYRQWEFIQRLYSFFFDCIGKKLQTQEVINSLQRWFLSIQQNKKTKDPDLPLFPFDMSENDAESKKFASDLCDKKLTLNMRESWIIFRKTIKQIENFRAVCKANPNPETPDYKQVETIKGKSKIIIGKFESVSTVRVHFLITTFGLENTGRMLLRYESLGNGSYQWGDPKSVHKLYYTEFDARYEGFASPLNSRFLGQIGTRFCSVFYDTDAVFGSLGDFYDVDFFKFPGGWSVNPPFLEIVLESAARKVINALDAGVNCYFFLCYPTWRDSTGWIMLDQTSHKVARYDCPADNFIVQDAYGDTLRPRMKLTFFIIGKLPKECPSVERVREVVFRASTY